jgi:ribonucleoside-triphosphate reductase
MKTLRTAVDLTADDRRRIEEAWPEEADECLVTVEDGFLCARFVKTHEHFERIRRITGYLTGTLEKWNDAKRAEERERVKHALRDEGCGEAANEGPARGVTEGSGGAGNEGRPSAE